MNVHSDTLGITVTVHLSRVTDANNNRAELNWDGFDRQRRWIFPNAATGLPSLCGANPCDYEEYGYDAVGNRTSLRKRDGSTLTYTYDNLNRLILKTVPERPGLAATHTRDVHYGYDIRNLQLFARFDSAAGQGVTNVYDGFGRLASSTTNMDGVSRTLAYQYDGGSRRTRITFPDSVGFGSTYHPSGHANTLTDPAGSAIALFSYDPAGRPNALGRPGATSGFQYDPVGRLNSLSHYIGAPLDVLWTFAHNPAGQIVTRTRSNDAYASTSAYTVSRVYAVNGLNQYTAAGPAVFQYDANGNLVSDGTRTFAYDVENRLVTASGGVTLRYDPLGRLYEVVGASGTRRFLHDGDALVAEYNTAGAMTDRYVHGSGAGDDPLLWYPGTSTAAGNRRNLLADHQGSIVAVGNNAGNRLFVNAYDPWGIPNASNQGRFQYTGQIWIPELGMYHYKGRVYSPTLGRFPQTDPVGYDDQINLYAYVANDPVNRVDPDGKCTNRDATGECVVTNRAGAAGVRAAGQLQAQVRRVDHAIRTLDPKQKIRVDVGNGRFREMTGAQVARAWARTDWAIDPDTTQYRNGLGAQMDNGRYSTTPSYFERYRHDARAWGRDEDEATRSVVLHDFGHSTRVGRDIDSLYPGSSMQRYEMRERATSRTGAAIGNAIGETFECQTFLLGC